MSLRIIVTFVPLLKPEVYVTFPSAELTSVHCFVSIVSFVCVLLPPINKTDETHSLLLHTKKLTLSGSPKTTIYESTNLERKMSFLKRKHLTLSVMLNFVW